MKRIRIDLEDIAEQKNLTLALHRAARGKRLRPDVAAFLARADSALNQLNHDILARRMPLGRFRSFQILDPKKRMIHAACFPDRVFHHAVMNQAGPVLERAMGPNSFACRPGMGVHKAVRKVQKNLQKYSWYVKIDIKGYFADIRHDLVLQVLLRRFKGQEFRLQLQRILDSYATAPNMGLPIGSLTSQYFANFFLNDLDQLLDNDQRVRAQVRYMDDIVWWTDSKKTAKAVLRDVDCWLRELRGLTIKNTVQIQPVKQGITWCGFRVCQGTIRLSRRRKRNFQQRRRYWEQLFLDGRIDELQLQAGYTAVQAITAGTDSRGWQRENLHRHPPLML
jgi:hypothetical protein